MVPTTDTIRIIKHEKAVPVTDIGDILKPFSNWEKKNTLTGAGWYSKVPEEVWKDKPFIPIPWINRHSWNALKILGIDAERFQKVITYECPWTQNQFWWYLPMYLFTDELEMWLDRCDPYRVTSWTRDIILDVEHMQHHYSFHDTENSFETGNVDEALLGHGYTEGTMPNDGHGSLYDATLTLSNGDYIGGKVWVWFNK